MKKIAIAYYPFRKVPWQRVARGKHPETWEEITPRQLIAIASACKGRIKNERFIYIMTGLPVKVVKKLDGYQQLKLMELLDFISDLKLYHSFILDRIKAGNQVFHAPKDRLKEMTFGQFIFADSFFNNYQATSRREEVCNFLAALYLPKGCDFREAVVETNSPLMEKIDAVTREACIINYLLIREWLTEKYPLVFIRSPEKEQKTKSTYDPAAWVKIFDNLVGDDLVNYQRYANLPLHSVLRFMTRKIKENMKRK